MVCLVKGLFVLYFMFNSTLGQGELRRKKRWLVFPKGSSLQLVYCFLVSDLWTRDGIFVVGLTVGLAWEIPTNLRELALAQGEDTLHSRHRRQLYTKISLLLTRQGVDGESCIHRAVCEAKRVDATKKMKFVHSILYALFTLPELDNEDEDILKYKEAQQKSENCSHYFPCPLSIFHFS